MDTSLPVELRDVLAGHADALARWERLQPTHREEYVQWIDSAKNPETRRCRALKALEMLARELEAR